MTISVSNPCGQHTPPPQLIVIASPVILSGIWVGLAMSPVSQTMLDRPLETNKSRLIVLLHPMFSITPPSVQQAPHDQLPVMSGGDPLNSPASSCTETNAVGGRQEASNCMVPPEPSLAMSAIRNKLMMPVLISSYRKRIRVLLISSPVLALEAAGAP